MPDNPNPARDNPARHNLLLAGDIVVHRIPLNQLLSAYGFSVVLLEEENLLLNYLEHRAGSIALVLLNLSHASVGGLELAKKVVLLARKQGAAVAGIYNSIDLTPRSLEKIGIQTAIDAFALPEEIVDKINHLLFRGRDSRREVRVFVYLPAAYRHEGKDVACRVTSLSLGGLFLQTDVLQPSGTPISFTIQLNPNQRVTGTGTALYCLMQQSVGDIVKVSGMGVRFDRLDLDGAKLLGEFYRRHLDRYVEKKQE